MRIGIDIDGVLTNVEQYVVDNFTKYCYENDIEYIVGESNYHHHKTFSVSKEVENQFWSKHIFDYALTQQIRSYASEVIKKLKEDGHEIYIITARWLTNKDDELGLKMKKIVKDWLDDNQVNYDKLVFSLEDKEKKGKEIIENKIDIMIEDSPSNINDLSQLIPVICYNTTYNQSCNGTNIIRCYSWYDIYKHINKFYEGYNGKI